MCVTWRGTGAAHRRRLAARPLMPGVVRVATCARVAWFAVGEGANRALDDQYAGVAGLSPQPEQARGDAAVRRAFEVAAGLDSAVQGERQIGSQFRTALAGASTGLENGALLHTLDHVLARLLARGRRAGWQRANTSIASLAAGRVRWSDSVGVVGDGEMARLATKSLSHAGVPFTAYNRTPRGDVRPLSALRPHDGWIVATAAPSAWLSRPAGRIVIDLGQPPQVLGEGVLRLDSLLSESGMRLPEELLVCAVDHVSDAVAEFCARASRRLREVA